MTEEGKTYDKAVEKVAGDCHRSEKWVQACYTKANKLERWIEECRSRGLNHTDGALEMAFAYSRLRRVDPADSLKLTAEGLAQIISHFEQMVMDARGNARGSGFI